MPAAWFEMVCEDNYIRAKLLRYRQTNIFIPQKLNAVHPYNSCKFSGQLCLHYSSATLVGSLTKRMANSDYISESVSY